MQQAGGLAAPKGSFLGQIAIAGYFGLSNVNKRKYLPESADAVVKNIRVESWPATECKTMDDRGLHGTIRLSYKVRVAKGYIYDDYEPREVTIDLRCGCCSKFYNIGWLPASERDAKGDYDEDDFAPDSATDEDIARFNKWYDEIDDYAEPDINDSAEEVIGKGVIREVSPKGERS